MRNVKAQLHHRHRAPTDQWRLVFAGKQLVHGDSTLADYGVGEGSTLELLDRLRGGIPAKGDTIKGTTPMTRADSAPCVATALSSFLLAWA